MDLSSYRREYAAFRSAVERERYTHCAGLSASLNLEPIRERYSDLWTRETISELRTKLEDAPAHFETERAGLRALICAASLKYAEAKAREIRSELDSCVGASLISWSGEKVRAEDALELISRESDATRRRELAARWLDAARSCDDLRAAYLEELKEATRSLGYESRRALYEETTCANPETLAGGAYAFLEATSDAYAESLARWKMREGLNVASDLKHPADSFYFRRASHLDALFPSRGARSAYAATLSDLNIKLERQTNVRVDVEARTRKNLLAHCFGLEPPKDVRLFADSEATGAAAYSSLFYAGGQAQHFAWTSKDLAARHPEFVHAPDTATRDGAGRLLASLFRDAEWAAERLNLRATDARELARAVALLDLEDTRRACAGLRHALALDAATDVRSEQLAESYARLHAEALGFAHDPATHLTDALKPFDAATRLRAHLLASSLREHLRARYGRRWHASRAAGDELIDVWSAASRYHAEELARLAWGGELDFALLAEEFKASLKAE